jgi:hypothetical protein
MARQWAMVEVSYLKVPEGSILAFSLTASIRT